MTTKAMKKLAATRKRDGWIKVTKWISPKSLMNKEIFRELQWINADRKDRGQKPLEWAKFKKDYLAR